MAGKLRITGGSLRGRQIDVPKAADVGELRPTPDRVRSAIFSSLANWIEGAVVLDVFAGSGVQAIEALSRGAKSATLVEMNAASAATIKSNAQKLGLEKEVHVVLGDAFKEVPRFTGQTFDIIFADPPYRLEVSSAFWEKLSKILSHDGIVVFRREKLSDLEVPLGYEVIREKKYGGTAVFFLRSQRERSDLPR